MDLDVLNAVSPIDGRYHSKSESLSSYFSEYALIKYRIFYMAYRNSFAATE